MTTRFHSTNNVRWFSSSPPSNINTERGWLTARILDCPGITSDELQEQWPYASSLRSRLKELLDSGILRNELANDIFDQPSAAAEDSAPALLLELDPAHKTEPPMPDSADSAATITADRYHDFSAGHRVHGHESKCAHLHGHNYRVTFTVQGAALDALGRVLDFSEVKSALCDWLEQCWDHKFLVYYQDPAQHLLHELDPAGVVVVPFNPTAENMAKFLLRIVGPVRLPKHIRLVQVRVDETRKCGATAHV